MADITLTIKLPEEIYKVSQILDANHEHVVQIPLEVIKEGTPLQNEHERTDDTGKEPKTDAIDKIRDEIKKDAEYYEGYINIDIAQGLYRALDTIDKYIKE